VMGLAGLVIVGAFVLGRPQKIQAHGASIDT